MFGINITTKAARQLKKIEKKNAQDYRKVNAAIRELRNYPNVSNVKALTDHQYGYRKRVGNYRIFFDVQK
ncbi:MAG: type II toxin-antitoxin system RelE/ParE family toxin, partial [Deinococcota bacterium]